MEEILTDGNGNWVSQEFLDTWEKFQQKMERNFLLSDKDISHKRYLLNEDNRKWAWILVGKTKMLCYVDNKTMKAYKADGYSKTWMEWQKFTFIRWATSFDL